MTIYHFILSPAVGGPHIYATSLAHALSSRAGAVLLTAGKGPLTDIPLANFRHFWNPLYVFEIVVNIFLIILFTLTGKISRKKALFHVHGAANIAPVIAARIIRVPVVWTIHEIVAEFRSLFRLGAFFLRTQPHRLVVVTDAAAKVYGLGMHCVIPGAVDLSFWKKPSLAAQRPETLFRIVVVANLNPLKGQDILLKSLAELPGKWQAVLIGKSLATWQSFSEKLEQQADMIRKHNPDATIIFAGWQGQEEVRAHLHHADCFVLPSRSEACPISLLEAMAMECVCVASRVGGVDTIIEEGGSGFLVAAADHDQLRDTLQRIQKMAPDERREIGQRARQRIKERFSPVPMADAYWRLYQELLPEGVPLK